MTHALDKVRLNTRPDNHGLSRPVVANQRTRAARRVNAPAATRKLTRPLWMRWSTGPDGRLSCAWHRPTPRRAIPEPAMLAHDHTPEAIVA
jgi:hypothetical protein